MIELLITIGLTGIGLVFVVVGGLFALGVILTLLNWIIESDRKDYEKRAKEAAERNDIYWDRPIEGLVRKLIAKLS